MIISALVKIRSIYSSDAELSYLSDAEAKRAHKMNKASAQRFIIGRTMLRSELSMTLGISPQDVRLNQNEGGPVTLSDSDLSFSVAHSGDYVAVAVAKRGAIGIDIEDGHIERKNWRGIAKRYFNMAEQDFIEAEPKLMQQQAFYRLWTAKEALTKMEHGAIAHYLKGAEISCQNDPATVVDSTPKGNNGNDIILQHRIEDDGRMIACVAAIDGAEVRWDIKL